MREKQAGQGALPRAVSHGFIITGKVGRGEDTFSLTLGVDLTLPPSAPPPRPGKEYVLVPR